MTDPQIKYSFFNKVTFGIKYILSTPMVLVKQSWGIFKYTFFKNNILIEETKLLGKYKGLLEYFYSTTAYQPFSQLDIEKNNTIQEPPLVAPQGLPYYEYTLKHYENLIAQTTIFILDLNNQPCRILKKEQHNILQELTTQKVSLGYQVENLKQTINDMKQSLELRTQSLNDIYDVRIKEKEDLFPSIT